MNKIKALIEAGEKATQGNYTVDLCGSGEDCWCRLVGLDHSEDNYVVPSGCLSREDATFFALAANARAEIKDLYEQHEALQGTIESQKQTFDALMKKYRAYEEAAELMVEALLEVKFLETKIYSTYDQPDYGRTVHFITIERIIHNALDQYNKLKGLK